MGVKYRNCYYIYIQNDQEEEEDDDEEYDSDDDDDGVQVVIGDTKSSATNTGQIPFGGTVGVTGVKRPAPTLDKKVDNINI